MSSSSRYYQPRCTVCFKGNIRKKLLDLPYKTWTYVEFVRLAGDGAILRCKNCGYEWRSYSKFAKEKLWELRYLSKSLLGK